GESAGLPAKAAGGVRELHSRREAGSVAKEVRDRRPAVHLRVQPRRQVPEVQHRREVRRGGKGGRATAQAVAAASRAGGATMPDSDPSKRLAAALGRVPSGLYILTARHGDAETGMLVSWVQQRSFAPPLVSAAIQRGRDILSWLPDGAPFT